METKPTYCKLKLTDLTHQRHANSVKRESNIDVSRVVFTIFIPITKSQTKSYFWKQHNETQAIIMKRKHMGTHTTDKSMITKEWRMIFNSKFRKLHSLLLCRHGWQTQMQLLKVSLLYRQVMGLTKFKPVKYSFVLKASKYLGINWNIFSIHP